MICYSQLRTRKKSFCLAILLFVLAVGYKNHSHDGQASIKELDQAILSASNVVASIAKRKGLDNETKSKMKGSKRIETANIKPGQQLDRIKHFRQQCTTAKLEASNTGNSSINVLYSEEYKLAYRQVNKIGSTFMIQVFELLTKAGTEAVFNVSRLHVHDERVESMRKRLTLDVLSNYTTLIVARNPYSRIFSAYIDKVYLWSHMKWHPAIYSNLYGTNEKSSLNHTCQYHITFEQFLKYIFSKNHKGNCHYNPVLSLAMCKKVCNLRNIIIVKQESFSEDLVFAFKSVGVKGKTYDVIYDEMHSKHTESTVASIVRTLYETMPELIKLYSCLNWKTNAERLWKSFQIQGYIHEESKFPHLKFQREENYRNSEFLIKVIKEELQQRPLNHEEKVRQRTKALIHAYSSKEPDYFRKIQKRYALDFEMFQYNTDLQNFGKV